MMMCLGPIQGSPSECLCVCVCLCVCASARVCVGAAKCVCQTKQESTQWAALLQNNDLNQVQVLSTTQVFSPKPLQLVFIDKRTSCSLSPRNLKERKSGKKKKRKKKRLHLVLLFAYLRPKHKHSLCDILGGITKAALCHFFFKAAQERENNQAAVIR